MHLHEQASICAKILAGSPLPVPCLQAWAAGLWGWPPLMPAKLGAGLAWGEDRGLVWLVAIVHASA